MKKSADYIAALFSNTSLFLAASIFYAFANGSNSTVKVEPLPSPGDPAFMAP